ncbi:MAG: 16S rRNA (guanine(527)-N(7))-methyltransferase RsmG [Chloroflexota bacterium]|nr:16S rRNA (guanine(527)-N(7))-methyltransferase RsmG [Chloroflexota bacterium]
MSSTDADADAARAALDRHLTDAPGIAGGLPAGFGDAVQRFVALLLEANGRMNLTRVTLPGDVARLHLLDALAALPIIDRLAPRHVIDLGSGGGIPALPLALARPDMRWTLVDSVARKATVLRGFVDALGLHSITVLADRAEALGVAAEHRESYDLVTARACAPLPVLAELSLPLLVLGGSLLAWKGPLDDGADEVRGGRIAAGQLGGGRLEILATGLPALGGHRFVTIRKERPTPERFPRRAGEPARRPLG